MSHPTHYNKWLPYLIISPLISTFVFLLNMEIGMDITIACCFISFLTTVIFYREKIEWNGYKTVLVCYIILGVYYELWGANSYKSGALRTLIYASFFILTAPSFFLNKKLLKFLVILSISLLFLQAVYQHHYLGITRIGDFINPIQYATICATLSLFLFIFIIEEPNKKHQFGLTILFVASLITLVYTGSRGPWLAFVCGFFLITIFGFKQIKKNINHSTLIFAALFTCATLTTASPILKERLSSINADHTLYQKKNFETSTGARLHLWATAIYSIKRDNFMGLNVSYKDNIKELSDAGVYQVKTKLAHFHSTYLDRLAKFGLLGLALCLALALYPFLTSLKYYKSKRTFFLLAFTPPCIYLTTGVTDTVFRAEESLFFFLIVNHLPFLLKPDLSESQLICSDNFNKKH